jgi:hypothetical protein
MSTTALTASGCAFTSMGAMCTIRGVTAGTARRRSAGVGDNAKGRGGGRGRAVDDLGENAPAKTAKRKRGPGKPWQPGVSPNPNGRPPGSRNRTTIACEALLAGEAEEIVRKAVELAKAGDVGMIRTLLGFILPTKKDRHLTLTLPPIETAQDALLASRAIVQAVAAGELSPAEGGEMSKAIETHIKLLEAVDLETRLVQLEQERGIPTGSAALGSGQ